MDQVIEELQTACRERGIDLQRVTEDDPHIPLSDAIRCRRAYDHAFREATRGPPTCITPFSSYSKTWLQAQKAGRLAVIEQGKDLRTVKFTEATPRCYDRLRPSPPSGTSPIMGALGKARAWLARAFPRSAPPR